MTEAELTEALRKIALGGGFDDVVDEFRRLNERIGELPPSRSSHDENDVQLVAGVMIQVLTSPQGDTEAEVEVRRAALEAANRIIHGG